MNKRLLSALLALCMAFALLPAEALAEIHEYPPENSNDMVMGGMRVVEIDGKGYSSLQNAVNEAQEGQTIKLMLGYKLSSAVTIAGDNATSFIFDLNGYTLDSFESVIRHEGGGTLTITDNRGGGKVTTTAAGSETILINGGSLVVESGTIEHAGSNLGSAINNCWGGSVEIKGGTVYCAGVNGSAILNQYSALNISGGVVRANVGTAIFINGTGNVAIGGTALITSAENRCGFGTIFLPAAPGHNTDTVLKITGGTIENTAQTDIQTAAQYETTNAINNSSAYTVEISGGVINATGERGVGIRASKQGSIVILSGASVVKGYYMAMNPQPPVLRLDAQLRAGKEYASDALQDYNLTLLFTHDVPKSRIYDYKYLRFGPSTAVAAIDNKFYTDLEDAFNQGASESTIRLMADINLGRTVFNENGRKFTLDLNGKTLSCLESRGPLYNAMGELTITDSSEGVQGHIEGTVTNYGTLIIAGGTVSASGNNAIAIHSPPRGSGPSIVGGTVSASGNNAVAIKNESLSAVRISGDAVISSTAYAIVTGSAGVIIEGGWPVIKGGQRAINRAPSFNPDEMLVTASGFYEGTPSVPYYALYITSYKHLGFAPAPVENDNDQGSPSPAENAAEQADLERSNVAVWLSGGNPSDSALLTARPITGGETYNAMLRLADKGDVIGIYDISLQNGEHAVGGALYLTFDLSKEHAGQGFTLVHKKADGTFEYLYDTADSNGRVKFGPVYEFSPFMLVKGTLIAPAPRVPNTGDGGSPWLIPVLLSVAGVCALPWQRKRKSA